MKENSYTLWNGYEFSPIGMMIRPFERGVDIRDSGISLDNTEDYVVTEKLDGARMGLYKFQGEYVALSNQMNIHKYPIDNFADYPDGFYDGELLCDSAERAPRAVIAGLFHKEDWDSLTYNVFDYYALDDESYTKPYAERLKMVIDMFPSSGKVRSVPYLGLYSKLSSILSCCDVVVSEGGEGVVAHLAKLPRIFGRTDQIKKIKKLFETVGTIVDVAKGDKTPNGSLIIVLDNMPVTLKVSSGLTKEQRYYPKEKLLNKKVEIEYFKTSIPFDFPVIKRIIGIDGY